MPAGYCCRVLVFVPVQIQSAANRNCLGAGRLVDGQFDHMRGAALQEGEGNRVDVVIDHDVQRRSRHGLGSLVLDGDLEGADDFSVGGCFVPVGGYRQVEAPRSVGVDHPVDVKITASVVGVVARCSCGVQVVLHDRGGLQRK